MNRKFEKYTDAETFSKIVDYSNVTEMWNHSVATYPNNIAIVDGVGKFPAKECPDSVAPAV